MPRRLVVALGGNALIRPGEEGTVAQQLERAREVAAQLAAVPSDVQLVVTHGNGPQVGRLLLRSDLCAADVPPVPLDVAVASTQGEIGWLLRQALSECLSRPVSVILTHVRVSADDPDFDHPTKYIGRFYLQDEAKLRAQTLGWTVREDPGRGWRRVVPSPMPLDVLELDAIETLLGAGNVVVACGGGGIPVLHAHGRTLSVQAVVDKDRASALLAAQLDADRLVILTGVDEVMVDFGTPTQRPLFHVTADELQAFQAQGQFPAGSMGPKIEAALSFLAAGGAEVLITSPERFAQALAGSRGTRIQLRSREEAAIARRG